MKTSQVTDFPTPGSIRAPGRKPRSNFVDGALPRQTDTRGAQQTFDMVDSMTIGKSIKPLVSDHSFLLPCSNRRNERKKIDENGTTDLLKPSVGSIQKEKLLESEVFD